MAKVLVGTAVSWALLALVTPAFSQMDAPPSAAYPEPIPTAGAPAAPGATPAAPGPTAPTQAQTMGTSPPPVAQPAAPAAPPPVAQTAAPGAPPPSQQPPPGAYPPPNNGYNVGHSPIVEPPPPPPKEEKAFERPEMSVRVDPLNWLIYGRLGIEFETALYKFISLELVPVFVTDDQPPYMNLGSLPATLSQKSNGLGAMSGASIGAGFWLSGDPFRGTVLRFSYTNYGYTYTSKDDAGTVIDQASHTERHLVGQIGSHYRWGAFTIASGIGLGMEMNRERRCYVGGSYVTSGCNKDVFELGITRRDDHQNLNGALHPVYLTFRLSLGVVF